MASPSVLNSPLPALECTAFEGTASLLNKHFGLLWRGRRTALPRHQTLSATLDWSYNLLSRTEQLVLRRLAVFVGGFSLDAALDVAAKASIPLKLRRRSPPSQTNRS